jgi:hypothetical protein
MNFEELVLSFSVVAFTFPDEFRVIQVMLFYYYNVKIGKRVA